MNRLANSQSPYLLQHKNNPVDWYPWSKEAFEKAEKENKPIFFQLATLRATGAMLWSMNHLRMKKLQNS